MHRIRAFWQCKPFSFWLPCPWQSADHNLLKNIFLQLFFLCVPDKTKHFQPPHFMNSDYVKAFHRLLSRFGQQLAMNTFVGFHNWAICSWEHTETPCHPYLWQVSEHKHSIWMALLVLWYVTLNTSINRQHEWKKPFQYCRQFLERLWILIIDAVLVLV